MLWISISAAALVVGALGLAVTVQGARFRGRIAKEARELWSLPGAGLARTRLPEELPEPVRRYAEASGAARRAPIRAVRLRHGGTFRPALDKGWLPIRGEEYLSADPPGFVWWGRVRAAPGVSIEARDRSVAGEGAMLIKIASSWTLGDSRGPEIDQGALMRLLGELVWLPTALLDARYVGWAAVDAESAGATLRVGGRAATAIFHLGPDGLPSRIVADRYRDVGGRGVRTPWIVRCGDYRDVGGVRVPYLTDAGWEIDGEVRWYARWLVERIEVDRAEPF